MFHFLVVTKIVRTTILYLSFLCLRRDTFFQQLKKVSKESRHCVMLINVLQCFYKRRPPSPARAVPTPHLAFHAPPCPHKPTSPTAQRPTPPVSPIQVLISTTLFIIQPLLKSPHPKTHNHQPTDHDFPRHSVQLFIL